MQIINSKLCWLLRFLLPTLPAFDCCFAAWLVHAGQAQFTMVCYNQLICQYPMHTIGYSQNLQHCIVAFPIASFILASRYVVAQFIPCFFWIGFVSKCPGGTAFAFHTPGTTSQVSEQPQVVANFIWCLWPFGDPWERRLEIASRALDDRTRRCRWCLCYGFFGRLSFRFRSPLRFSFWLCFGRACHDCLHLLGHGLD